MGKFLKIETRHNGYSPDQCGETITVRELIGILKQYKGDMKVYFSNDNGYTYGSLEEDDIEQDSYEEEEEE